jgi:hypothetical protein
MYACTEVRRNRFSVRVAEQLNKHTRETRKSTNVQQLKRMLKIKWKEAEAEKKSDEKQLHEAQSTALKI